MRRATPFSALACLTTVVCTTALPAESAGSAAASSRPETTIRAIYTEALEHGRAYDNLRALVANHPGRLSGSPTLEHAVAWTQEAMAATKPDRVFTQDVMVPHWERGEAESVFMLDSTGVNTLSACALGGSGATPKNGILAEVVEVHSLDELTVLSRAGLEGKIVFFNRPMDPTVVRPGQAYGGAVDQRTRGAAAAAKWGAVGVVVRSMTHALNDLPHTGVTIFPAGTSKIPAAAISTLAADRLSAAIVDAKRSGASLRVGMKINAQWLPDAPSHNVVAEIRGSEFPDDILLVGGHLDSWDIAPGAHDDGAGVVQSIEVLRIFRALGLKPKHTLRAVAFVNEENGTAGALAYAKAAKAGPGKHLLAIETDAGGFQPTRFTLTSRQGDPAPRAARWLPALQPYGIYRIENDEGGTDVTPLLELGAVVGEIRNDSQRYFEIHHTKEDSIDKVNPRELHLGAAALASLIWLIDTEGL